MSAEAVAALTSFTGRIGTDRRQFIAFTLLARIPTLARATDA
jgi:hypothetical protein